MAVQKLVFKLNRFVWQAIHAVNSQIIVFTSYFHSKSVFVVTRFSKTVTETREPPNRNLLIRGLNF